VHPNDHPYDSDLVEIDDNQRVVAFHSKPHEKNRYFRNLVNAGFYIMSPKVLKYIRNGAKADFGKDVFPKIFKKIDFYGYNTSEYLKDVGVPERLLEVEKDYFSGKIRRLNNGNKRRAIFMDRDGVINKKAGLLYKIKDFELIRNAGKAIKKINDSEFLAIVITNQPVIARGLCSIKELEEIHKKMETLLGREGARLDAIYYCPHHPDKGFPGENLKYKIKCGCRKPKIGLVKRAQKDFNIDLKNSYFIGDSHRDILCGKNTGLITIGVRTGNACKDCETKPDYLFDNILGAVNFIIKNVKTT
jgi:D,D-heptose 1,7-bisphosphate phosphatase